MRRNGLLLITTVSSLLWLGIVYFTSVEHPDVKSLANFNYTSFRRFFEDKLASVERRLSEQKKANQLILTKIEEAAKHKVSVDGLLKLLDNPSLRVEDLVQSDKTKEAANEEYSEEVDEGADDDADSDREAADEDDVNPLVPDEEIKVNEKDVLGNDAPIIPVLLFSCNRPSVNRALDLLLAYRPDKDQFPIIVTQDCGHKETRNVIQSYGDQIIYIQQPDLSEPSVPPKETKFKGYFKIARHYGWALNQTFNIFGHQQVIIVEDDLEVSPDFYEYFLATLPLLRGDSSLWCVSAWNDNGKRELIDESAPQLLYRTDFFPGLGWMITKELWNELSVKWPRSYWDDWMRDPPQRRERSCIRPEISRTKTFGKIGVSNGQFYEKHLKFIVLSQKFVPFSVMNLDYLLKDNYANSYLKMVENTPVVTFEHLLRSQSSDKDPVRVIYHTRQDFKRISKALGIMDDFKSGVPRMAYRGIVSFIHKGQRVYLSPNINWKGYDPKWS